MKTSRLVLAVLPLLGATTQAQTTITPIGIVPISVTTGTATSGNPAQPNTLPLVAADVTAATGETTVALDIGFGIRFVPASRITVPAGEKLRINAPSIGTVLTYVWTKNGRAIPGATSGVLMLDYVTAGDAGTYACQMSTATASTLPSQQLVLGVGPTDRLLNLSARGFVGSGAGQEFIAGFVVASNSGGKKIVVRAVGPSLSLFGVANPLRQPVVRIFDARGQVYTNGFVYPAVVGGPTYESDLADSLARCGAFPIPAGTRDAVLLMPFVPGNYTVQVTSGDGSTGAVLLEVYEVP